MKILRLFIEITLTIYNFFGYRGLVISKITIKANSDISQIWNETLTFIKINYVYFSCFSCDICSPNQISIKNILTHWSLQVGHANCKESIKTYILLWRGNKSNQCTRYFIFARTKVTKSDIRYRPLSGGGIRFLFGCYLLPSVQNRMTSSIRKWSGILGNFHGSSESFKRGFSEIDRPLAIKFRRVKEKNACMT